MRSLPKRSASLKQQPFTYLHVFTYSERPGTLAEQFGSPVPVSVRRERTSVLRSLSEKKNREFRQRMIGKKLPAVTLEQRGMALTSNFLKVEMSQPREPNRLVELQIGAVTEAGLREHSLLPVLHN